MDENDQKNEDKLRIRLERSVGPDLRSAALKNSNLIGRRSLQTHYQQEGLKGQRSYSLKPTILSGTL